MWCSSNIPIGWCVLASAIWSRRLLEGCALRSARSAQAPGTHRRTHSGHVDDCDRVCRQAVWPSSQRCAQASRNGAQGMRAGRAGQWDRPVVPPSCSLTSRIGEVGSQYQQTSVSGRDGQDPGCGSCFLPRFFSGASRQAGRACEVFLGEAARGTRTVEQSKRAPHLGRIPHGRTAAHPHPLPSYHFSEQFPEFPFIYRRSVIKDALGKARSYLSNLANWNTKGKKKGQPGNPGASNHPTLYDEAFCLDLDATDLRPGNAPALSASRSTPEPGGNGTTIRSN